MSKKITDENGNTYVQKKPFYKKIWFWLLMIVLVAVAAVGFAVSNSGSDSAKETNSSTTKKQADSYESIYDDYSEKLKAETPKLIKEYDDESKDNQDGVDGLAKISNSKVEDLAKINAEGVKKMAKYMLKHGSGKGDSKEEYEDWAEKLTAVYSDEGQKITDHYIQSAQ
ncbi:hypothetical protein [Weissella minor]|uniref:hypothetical protein n=2 Tax=Weissella minor TaxID=1620 RepID=UPI003AF3143F